MLPSNFVPEPSINRMWYFVFKMGMPIIKYVEFVVFTVTLSTIVQFILYFDPLRSAIIF